MVHGKSGYVIEVGAQRYKIVRPQCMLGKDEGVAVTRPKARFRDLAMVNCQ